MAKRMYQKAATAAPESVSQPLAEPPPGTQNVAVLAAAVPKPVEYPSSDGKPMADTDFQADTMSYAHNALKLHFQAKGVEAYVAMDTLIYYEKGKRRVRVAPGVFAVLGVDGRRRRSYRVWEEGRAPYFVLEVLSISTHLKDEGWKRDTYRRMGVREYFRYDPQGNTMAPRTGRRLVAEQLQGDMWQELEAGKDGSIRSEVLQLDLRVRRRVTEQRWRELRLRDPETGKDLPTPAETARQAELAERRAEREARAREIAEQAVHLLEQRADSAERRADSAERRADSAERRAESEARARVVLERRLAEYSAAMSRLNRKPPEGES